MQNQPDDENSGRRFLKRIVMYVITIFLITISVLMIFSVSGLQRFLVASPIIFICGVYLYVDLRIIFKGADSMEREPVKLPPDKPRQSRTHLDRTEAERQSGRVELRGNKLLWLYRGEIIAEVELDRVKLIGELTTNEGPYRDDWFIVFHQSEDFNVAVSTYAVGMHGLIDNDFKNDRGWNLETTLSWSTNWRNRIMWPDDLKDKEFWEERILPPDDAIEGIRMLFGNRKIQFVLTEDALKVLRQA